MDVATDSDFVCTSYLKPSQGDVGTGFDEATDFTPKNMSPSHQVQGAVHNCDNQCLMLMLTSKFAQDHIHDGHIATALFCIC